MKAHKQNSLKFLHEILNSGRIILKIYKANGAAKLCAKNYFNQNTKRKNGMSMLF
jgi:hypothetical protein